jgi:hypothetical protein
MEFKNFAFGRLTAEPSGLRNGSKITSAFQRVPGGHFEQEETERNESKFSVSSVCFPHAI